MEKSCKNCAFYRRHFIRLNNNFADKIYSEVNFGHCMNKNKRVTDKKSTAPCAKWEQTSETAQNERLPVRGAIESISARIDEILTLIKKQRTD